VKIINLSKTLFEKGLEGRDSQTTPVHVVNIEIQDNHEEATIGAFLMCELVSMVIIFSNCCF
jgi:RNA polymerase II subunit A C-terminal domain phosphatase SSU72